jgi:hypothetical protein
LVRRAAILVVATASARAHSMGHPCLAWGCIAPKFAIVGEVFGNDKRGKSVPRAKHLMVAQAFLRYFHLRAERCSGIIGSTRRFAACVCESANCK